MEIINIFTNNTDKSKKLYEDLGSKLENHGYKPHLGYDDGAVLNICIGGDGSFLRAVQETNFSQIPFVGINTGSLGFFQEILTDKIDDFLDIFKEGAYSLNKLIILNCEIKNPEGGLQTFQALNDFVVRAKDNRVAKLEVEIDGNHLESFAGDGLIISTPAGSTAYNFSVGGSILYQELKGFQLAPIAPINTKAYRSLSNSLVLSKNEILEISSQEPSSLIVDGIPQESQAKTFKFYLSDTYINKLVIDPNLYWKNLKEKFL